MTSMSTSTYVPSGLSTSTSTEIRYSSTTSTSTKYSGPNPGLSQWDGLLDPNNITERYWVSVLPQSWLTWCYKFVSATTLMTFAYRVETIYAEPWVFWTKRYYYGEMYEMTTMTLIKKLCLFAR